ncbi:hypothetical protein RJG79_03110 [Mycoplasmatota bacterium WC44]
MNNIYEFLMENGSISTRYRTLTELYESDDINLVKQLEDELVDHKETVKRLLLLQSDIRSHDFVGVHGATNEHLENSLFFILELGLNRKFSVVDEILQPKIKKILDNKYEQSFVFYMFIDIIIFPLLYKAGYRNDWLIKFYKDRINILYQFTLKKDYNIYADRQEYKGIPKIWEKFKLVKPELCEGGNFKYPLIYDIVALAKIITDCDKETEDKIETIINYILSDEYHSLIDDAYGIIVRNLDDKKNKRYLRMGWDAKVPGYFGEKIDQTQESRLLGKLELMAHFNTSINSIWFKNWMTHLESFKTDKGTYIFPDIFLKTKIGSLLGENKRKKQWREVESTFRIMKIKKVICETNKR